MSALRAQVDAFPLLVPFRWWRMRAHGRVSTRNGIVNPGRIPSAEMKWRWWWGIAGSQDGKYGEHPANWRQASMIGASSASSNSAKPGFEGNAVTRITFPFMPGPYTSRLSFAFTQEPSTHSPASSISARYRPAVRAALPRAPVGMFFSSLTDSIA
jgi:hypothetical protein